MLTAASAERWMNLKIKTVKRMELNDNVIRRMWYNHTPIKFEIVKSLRKKELQIIGEGISIRWLNVQHVNIFDSVRRNLNVESRPASLYRSLDQYQMIPLMSFNLRKRQGDYEAWAKIRPTQMLGSDLGFDLDCKDGTWKDAIPDNEALRHLLDSFGVKYANWMSGNHGFHFVIPYEDMPDDVKAMKYAQQIGFYKQIATIIAEKIESMDLSIYMPTRVLKCPYTLTKDNIVIFPLDKHSWEHLKSGDQEREKSVLDPLTVLRQRKVRDRGIFLQGNPDGIKKLIKEWQGWK